MSVVITSSAASASHSNAKAIDPGPLGSEASSLAHETPFLAALMTPLHAGPAPAIQGLGAQDKGLAPATMPPSQALPTAPAISEALLPAPLSSAPPAAPTIKTPTPEQAHPTPQSLAGEITFTPPESPKPNLPAPRLAKTDRRDLSAPAPLPLASAPAPFGSPGASLATPSQSPTHGQAHQSQGPAPPQADQTQQPVHAQGDKQTPLTPTQDEAAPNHPNPAKAKGPDPPPERAIPSAPSRESHSQMNAIPLPPIAARQADSPAPSADISSRPLPLAPRPLGLLIAHQASAGADHFDIELDPPDLGRLRVALTFAPGRELQIAFQAERAEALEWLVRERGELQRTLEQSGWRVEEQAMRFASSESDTSYRNGSHTDDPARHHGARDPRDQNHRKGEEGFADATPASEAGFDDSRPTGRGSGTPDIEGPPALTYIRELDRSRLIALEPQARARLIDRHL